MHMLLYLEGSIFEDNNKVELAALKKLEDSLIGEHDFEMEEQKFDEDTQVTKEKLEENLEIKEHDTAVEEKEVVRDNDDDDDKKNPNTEEDGTIIVAEQNDVATAIEPVPLPYATK